CAATAPPGQRPDRGTGRAQGPDEEAECLGGRLWPDTPDQRRDGQHADDRSEADHLDEREPVARQPVRERDDARAHDQDDAPREQEFAAHRAVPSVTRYTANACDRSSNCASNCAPGASRTPLPASYDQSVSYSTITLGAGGDFAWSMTVARKATLSGRRS